MSADMATTYWGLEGRRCGACSTVGAAALAPAQLYCRTCAEFLCRACDAASAGHARRGHARVWLCEVCEQAPAAVTCRADAAALCRSCDSDIHDANPLAQRHERVPVAPVDDADAWCAPAVDLNVGLAEEDGADGARMVDYLFSDLDPYMDLEYAAAMDGSVGQLAAPAPPAAVADCVVPFGGNGGGGAVVEIDFSKPAQASYSLSHSLSSSEAGIVPDHGATGGTNSAASLPPPAPTAVVGEEREARLMRYREKRKNRRFEKTIRYASRKAYAESRPRVKGRFAKRREAGEASPAPGPAAGKAMYFSTLPPRMFTVNSGYGVVPSF